MSGEYVEPEPNSNIDAETGEELARLPAPASPLVAHGEENTTAVLYRGVSVLPATEEQTDVLLRPCDDTELDILPTGEVYLSQVGYRRRLNEAFRPGGWALVPIDDRPIIHDRTMMQRWALYVGGRFIASAYGEQEYFEKNERQSYATAAESLKSNALMRCCKDLGIASECWDRHFTQQFKADVCVKVWRVKTKRPSGQAGVFQWRRRDAEPFYDEGGAKTDKNNDSDDDPMRRTLEAAGGTVEYAGSLAAAQNVAKTALTETHAEKIARIKREAQHGKMAPVDSIPF